MNVTGGSGLVMGALLFSSTAVAGSVGGKPVCAAAETRHGATVCGGWSGDACSRGFAQQGDR